MTAKLLCHIAFKNRNLDYDLQPNHAKNRTEKFGSAYYTESESAVIVNKVLWTSSRYTEQKTKQ